jgi:hypothetical protein
VEFGSEGAPVAVIAGNDIAACIHFPGEQHPSPYDEGLFSSHQAINAIGSKVIAKCFQYRSVTLVHSG